MTIPVDNQIIDFNTLNNIYTTLASHEDVFNSLETKAIVATSDNIAGTATALNVSSMKIATVRTSELVAETLLCNRSCVQLIRDRLLDKHVMMKLVKSVVLKFDTWSHKELQKFAVAGPCDLSNLRPYSIVSIWLDVAAKPKIRHRKRLEERNCHRSVDFVLR